MPDLWCVQLDDQRTTYGPFDNHADAADFALFLTATVDPSTIRPLRSPLREYEAWSRTVRSSGGGNVPAGGVAS